MIFNLSKDQKTQAETVMQKMEQESLVVAEFKNGPFNLFLVKDGTSEAQERKDSKEPVILFPITSENGQQYLIVMK